VVVTHFSARIPITLSVTPEKNKIGKVSTERTELSWGKRVLGDEPLGYSKFLHLKRLHTERKKAQRFFNNFTVMFRAFNSQLVIEN